MITTKIMNLFDSPENAILAHACNCLGIWGSGIARMFRDKYPEAAKEYRSICERDGKSLLGKALIVSDKDKRIGCLFTSYAFGNDVDDVSDILNASRTSIIDMFELARISGISEICSNEFNSGLFGVPWYRTEEILLDISQNYPDITWTVCKWS